MTRAKAASFARRSTSRKAKLRPVAADIELLLDEFAGTRSISSSIRKNQVQIDRTDRGDPPLTETTVDRASLDADFSSSVPVPDILLTHLMEGIGIALDLKGERMFLTDLAGTIYSARLRRLGKETTLQPRREISHGIAYAETSADVESSNRSNR